MAVKIYRQRAATRSSTSPAADLQLPRPRRVVTAPQASTLLPESLMGIARELVRCRSSCKAEAESAVFFASSSATAPVT